MLISLHLLPLALTLAGYAQAAISREVRSLLEGAFQMDKLVARREQQMTPTHVQKKPGQSPHDHYTNNPKHKFCLNRSAVVAGDDDIDNTPSKAGPPKAGETYGYILCSGIKKPNQSKYISTYLVKPKHEGSDKLIIRAIYEGIKPDNQDTADEHSFSYHYNATLPKDVRGAYQFFLVETYDIFEPSLKNLALTQSFPIVIS